MSTVICKASYGRTANSEYSVNEPRLHCSLRYLVLPFCVLVILVISHYMTLNWNELWVLPCCGIFQFPTSNSFSNFQHDSYRMLQLMLRITSKYYIFEHTIRLNLLEFLFLIWIPTFFEEWYQDILPVGTMIRSPVISPVWVKFVSANNAPNDIKTDLLKTQ